MLLFDIILLYILNANGCNEIEHKEDKTEFAGAAV